MKHLYLSPRNKCLQRIPGKFYIKMSSFVGQAISQVSMPLGEQGFLSLGEGIWPAMELNFLNRWDASFTPGASETRRRHSTLLKTGL